MPAGRVGWVADHAQQLKSAPGSKGLEGISAGQNPDSWVECGGGQGRGRTVDLPIFSRTLVPTELPGRAPKGAREEYPTTRHTQKMGYAVWPAPWTRSLARDASLVLGDLSPQLFDEIDQLRHDVVGDSTDGRLVLDAATGADQLRHRDR